MNFWWVYTPSSILVCTGGWIKPSKTFWLNLWVGILISTQMLLKRELALWSNAVWNWRELAVQISIWYKSAWLHVVIVICASSRSGIWVWNTKNKSLVWSQGCRPWLRKYTEQFDIHGWWHLIGWACSGARSCQPEGTSPSPQNRAIPVGLAESAQNRVLGAASFSPGSTHCLSRPSRTSAAVSPALDSPPCTLLKSPIPWLSSSACRLTARFYLFPEDGGSILLLACKTFGTPLRSFPEHALKACASACSMGLPEKEKVWREILKMSGVPLGRSCRYVPLRNLGVFPSIIASLMLLFLKHN